MRETEQTGEDPAGGEAETGDALGAVMGEVTPAKTGGEEAGGGPAEDQPDEDRERLVGGEERAGGGDEQGDGGGERENEENGRGGPEERERIGHRGETFEARDGGDVDVGVVGESIIQRLVKRAVSSVVSGGGGDGE